MNRRGFLAAGGCACMAPWLVHAQAWQPPERFARPDLASEEGGLWAMMDREESRLRRSPFALRDPALKTHVQDMACRLAGEHCPDIRVHLVRTPLFNASMAPNGMMQVWTGLLLRVENDAQLAAVLGHEIGHYLARHQLEQLREAKSRSAFAQFLGLFGLLGAVGQLGLLAGMFAYSREHENEADRIGVMLMHRAGYDAGEAAKVWGNLLLEMKARPGESMSSPLFATHPAPEERQAALEALARSHAGGLTNTTEWRERVRPHLREWLNEEVKRGQPEESLALLTRMLASAQSQPEYTYARGEVYRLRAREGDLQAAADDYRLAIATGEAPAEAHRGLGMVYRLRNQASGARASFERYLELAPEAPDAAMIRTYLEELQT